jgi:hypothetical protein
MKASQGKKAYKPKYTCILVAFYLVLEDKASAANNLLTCFLCACNPCSGISSLCTRCVSEKTAEVL